MEILEGSGAAQKEHTQAGPNACLKEAWRMGLGPNYRPALRDALFPPEREERGIMGREREKGREKWRQGEKDGESPSVRTSLGSTSGARLYQWIRTVAMDAGSTSRSGQ